MRGVSVFGLGKLGSCIAAVFADRGLDVTGVDIDRSVVERLSQGDAPVEEPGLRELIRSAGRRLQASSDATQAILSSDITFVIVPTPSRSDGSFSTEYLAVALESIGKGLAAKADYHTIVVTSTVLPRTMRDELLPLLERASGKTCGADFGLCYSPAFIALGSVIRDFTHPDFVLIGEHDERAGNTLESAYRMVVESDVPISRMSLENAELTKIALNSFVTLKITFANMLADLAGRMPTGNVDVVTAALGQDRRVGSRYLRGGMGFGGPCFPRDNLALAYAARSLGSAAPLPETVHAVNGQTQGHVLDCLRPLLSSESRVAVLGLAYKPGTPVVEESPGIALVRELLAAGMTTIAYDPLAGETARQVLPESVKMAGSLGEAVLAADVIVVATPDPAFTRIAPGDLQRPGGVAIFDAWRILPQELTSLPGVRYVALGRNQQMEPTVPPEPVARPSFRTQTGTSRVTAPILAQQEAETGEPIYGSGSEQL